MESNRKLTALERSNLFLLRKGENRGMEPWKVETQAREASLLSPIHQSFYPKGILALQSFRNINFWMYISLLFRKQIFTLKHIRFIYYSACHTNWHLNTANAYNTLHAIYIDAKIQHAYSMLQGISTLLPAGVVFRVSRLNKQQGSQVALTAVARSCTTGRKELNLAPQ